MVNGDFKDLARRKASDKTLRDKVFNITTNPKYDGSQRDLASIFNKFFDKMFSGSGFNTHANKSDFTNAKFAEELHKPIIRKFWTETVYSGFKDNIWGPDLLDIQLISKFNKGYSFYCTLLNFYKIYLGCFFVR